MLRKLNGGFFNVTCAFLSEDIEDTCDLLRLSGVQTKNEDGTYKTFNEVMEQIYSLHVHEGE